MSQKNDQARQLLPLWTSILHLSGQTMETNQTACSGARQMWLSTGPGNRLQENSREKMCWWITYIQFTQIPVIAAPDEKYDRKNVMTYQIFRFWFSSNFAQNRCRRKICPGDTSGLQQDDACFRCQLVVSKKSDLLKQLRPEIHSAWRREKFHGKSSWEKLLTQEKNY